MNVTFNIGTDIDIAALDVQNRVSIATPLVAGRCKPLRHYR